MNFIWKNWRSTKERSMWQKESTDLHNNSPAKTAATWSVNCEGRLFPFRSISPRERSWHGKDRKDFFWIARADLFLSAFRSWNYADDRN